MIEIGNFTFPSQESVCETVRTLVECYPAGSVIDEENEHEFLLSKDKAPEFLRGL